MYISLTFAKFSVQNQLERSKYPSLPLNVFSFDISEAQLKDSRPATKGTTTFFGRKENVMKYDWFPSETGRVKRRDEESGRRESETDVPGAKYPRKLDFCPAIAFPPRRSPEFERRVKSFNPPRDAWPGIDAQLFLNASVSRSLFSLSLSPLESLTLPSPTPFLLSPADLAEIAHRGRISAENLLILQARRARGSLWHKKSLGRARGGSS